MIKSALYSATATSTGGRVGTSASDDGRLSVTLDTPKEMGGAGGPGTNPEQLFASGYSACFLGALKAMAGKSKTQLSADTSITATVHFGEVAEGVGYGIAVDMSVSLPGLDAEKAAELVAQAHQICPYSNATRGNIDVNLTVV
jgi:osmotically inducible protein OsmC